MPQVPTLSPTGPSLEGPHTTRTFGRKELVFRPETRSDEIYLVVEGKIRLFMMDPSGREFTISILSPGDMFSGHTRCYGEAIGEVRVAVTDCQSFLEILQQQPETGRRLITVLGRCLKHSFDIIEALVFKACSSRLASMLLVEAEAQGEPCQAGIRVTVDLTTEQIASRIGTARQTISTLLNEWERSGLLLRRKGRWVITDLERLRRISASGEDE